MNQIGYPMNYFAYTSLFLAALATFASPAMAQVSILDGDLNVDGIASITDGESALGGLNVGEGGAAIDGLMSADENGARIDGLGLFAGGDGASIAGVGSAGLGGVSLNAGGGVILNALRVETNGSISFGSTFDTDELTAALEEKGAVINVNILFDSGSAALTAEGAAQVEQVAEALDWLDDDARILIEGHTDSVGSDADNFALSNARSQTVMNTLLLEHDIELQLLTGGKGESEPVATNETAEGRSLNRRVTFIRN